MKGFDENKCTIILFLDLTAAFDTIDIEKLLTILSEEIGVTGIAIQWFHSFLIGRSQKVRIKNEYSELMYGAPQGSVLGPKLFSEYVKSQPKVFNKCMSRQFLKINPDKMELLLLYRRSLENNVIIGGRVINDQQCIRFSGNVKNGDVWLDKHLNLKNKVKKVVSHCYKLLEDISRITSVLSLSHTEMLVYSVIRSRLDYCNSLFYNMQGVCLLELENVENLEP